MSADQNTARYPIEMVEASGGNTLDENSGRAAEFIFAHTLKPLMNWTQTSGNQFHTWTFIPGSLNGVKHIKTKGVRGVHYAVGEVELCKMIVTYGLEHAPRDLNDFPTEIEESLCIHEMKDWVEHYSMDVEESEISSKKAKKAKAANAKKGEKSARSEALKRSGARATAKGKTPKRSGARATDKGKNTSRSLKRGYLTRNTSGQAAKKSKLEGRKERVAQIDRIDRLENRLEMVTDELTKMREILKEASDNLAE